MQFVKGIIVLCIMTGWLSKVEAQELRILSYNIHHGCDTANTLQLKKMAALIHHSGADIVGLQEVDSVCRRSGQTDQAAVLGKLTGLHYAYVRHFAFDGGSYGLALLSRYPILSVTNKRLPVETDVNGSTRALLCAKLQLAREKTVEVWVAHLDYRSGTSRVRQAVLLDSMVRYSALPVLLTGDLNAPPADSALSVLTKHLQDGGPAGVYTYPSANAVRKIDYILADKKHFSIVKGAQVFPVTFSDHRPVLSIVNLR